MSRSLSSLTERQRERAEQLPGLARPIIDRRRGQGRMQATRDDLAIGVGAPTCRGNNYEAELFQVLSEDPIQLVALPDRTAHILKTQSENETRIASKIRFKASWSAFVERMIICSLRCDYSPLRPVWRDHFAAGKWREKMLFYQALARREIVRAQNLAGWRILYIRAYTRL